MSRLSQFFSQCIVSVVMLLNLFCIIPAFAEQTSPQVDAWLASQKTIRVIMPDWGHSFLLGLGNQTKSYNLMLRLWELGFNGTFELIYPKSERPGFTVLFNLPEEFNSHQDHYQFGYEFLGKKHTIIFNSIENYYQELLNGKIESVDLAVGGYIQDSPPCKYLDSVDTSSAFCNNYAVFANAKAFLRFDNGTSEVFSAAYLSVLDKPVETLLPGNDRQFFTVPAVNDLSVVDNYLSADSEGKKFQADHPGIQALINGIEMPKMKFNFLPVYGYTIGTMRLASDYQFPTNILGIIAGAREAQLKLAQANAPLPLIIGVFYDYAEEAAQLDKFINQDVSFYDIPWKFDTFETHNSNPAATLEGNKKEQYRIAIKNLTDTVHSSTLSLKGNFLTARLNDPETANIINNLKPRQVLLLSMGVLPKAVFDGLYTNMSNWSPVREGLSSFNSLVTTGKPHIRCQDFDGAWELGLNDIQDIGLKSLFQKLYGEDSGDTSRHAHPHFCSGINAWIQMDDPYYHYFAKVIIDSAQPDSAISNYFTQLKARALSPENDSIYQALTHAYEAVHPH